MTQWDNVHSPVLGIDLGTTFSAIARWDGCAPRVYQNAMGQESTPSVVYLEEREGRQNFLVGELAYRRGLIDPRRAVVGIKRHMDDRFAKIPVGSQSFSPVEISSKIVCKLHEDVANKFPQGVFSPRGAVVTVPYHFKAHQCQNTVEAVERAGLNVLGVIQEPVAASLAYGLHEAALSPLENILVFDLGGGTFDLTVFQLTNTPDQLVFEVLSTGGDDRLGGLDFDHKLMNYVLEKENLMLQGLPEDKVKAAQSKLLGACRQAKENLSFEESTFVTVADVLPGRHIDQEIDRMAFEGIIARDCERLEAIIERTLEKACLSGEQIDRVIKVGGSSYIPVMNRIIQNQVGANKIFGDCNPSLSVAQGAAIYAAYLDGRLSLDRNIEIKTRTAHAIGVGLADGSFCPVVPANRKTPCEATMVFGTERDNCTELAIDVYQGASRTIDGNTRIGTILITGLPAKPKGELDIYVTFQVGRDQTVSVKVEERSSGLSNHEMLRLA